MDSPHVLRIHRDIRRGAVTLILAAGAVLVGASPAEAGMPSVNLILTELGKRAEELSFFLVVFLLSAWGVQGLWNFLRRDFPRLPRLSYRGAVAAVLLWGLAMVVVLTMISGAQGADDAGGLRAERHHAQAEARRSRRGRHTGA